MIYTARTIGFLFVIQFLCAVNVYGTPVSYDLAGELHSKLDASWYKMNGVVTIESEPAFFHEYDADDDVADRFAVEFTFDYSIDVVGYGLLNNSGSMYIVSSGGSYHNGFLNGNELGIPWMFYSANGSPYSFAFDMAAEWQTLAPMVSWYGPDLYGTIFPELNWAHGFALLERSATPLPIPEPSTMLLMGFGIVMLRRKARGALFDM